MNIVKTNVLKAALHTLYYTRLDAAMAPLTQGAGVILMLHHVSPEPAAAFAPNRILTITPDFLDLVIEHLRAADFDIVSIDEAHARMTSQTPPRRRFATFTFDDGYRDNIDHALPVLAKHNVPMTIYVTPDFCDGVRHAWWLTLEKVLTEAPSITIPFPSGTKVFALHTTAQKYVAHREIYVWLRTLPDDVIWSLVKGWAMAADIDPRPTERNRVLTWDELREANKHPLVTLGAHTMSHAALAKCSAEDAEWEIAASIEHIEYELASACQHLAYPYGDATSVCLRDHEIARKLGLRTAVTTQKGLIGTNAQECLTALPRLSLNGDFQDERFLQVLLTGAPFKMLQLAKSALPYQAATHAAHHPN